MIKNILYVVSECQGFAVTGGLADVAGSLPKNINQNIEGYQVHVIMPLYREIINEYYEELQVVGTKVIQLSWRNNEMKLYHLKKDDTNYYFIGNDYYYNRDGVYGHFDDIERFAFFSKAVIDSFDLLGFIPEIVHVNDWHSALVNIYLKLAYYNKYSSIKTILTIHNIQYQGIFAKEHLTDLTGLGLEHINILTYHNVINLLKGAIELSDQVTTVSPSYAEEIQTAEYAHGLEDIISKNKHKLLGILNGIDYDFYNPQTDPNIYVNFGKKTLESKLNNKIELQKELQLPVNKDIIVMAIISRLVDHKGVDIFLDALPNILSKDVQIIVLGKGDKHYEQQFINLEHQYPTKVKALIKFNNPLAKKIYAGADLFIMPSKSEPCGLSQMIASRYGTVPLVRKTGGLGDSIYNYDGKDGNGFVFSEYNAVSLTTKINEALSLYQDKNEYQKLQKLVMTSDFSWKKSAREYVKMYEMLLK